MFSMSPTIFRFSLLNFKKLNPLFHCTDTIDWHVSENVLQRLPAKPVCATVSLVISSSLTCISTLHALLECVDGWGPCEMRVNNLKHPHMLHTHPTCIDHWCKGEHAGRYSRLGLVDHLTINGGHIPIDCGTSFDFIHASAFQNYEREDSWKIQKKNILESFLRKRKDIATK